MLCIIPILLLKVVPFYEFSSPCMQSSSVLEADIVCIDDSDMRSSQHLAHAYPTG